MAGRIQKKAKITSKLKLEHRFGALDKKKAFSESISVPGWRWSRVCTREESGGILRSMRFAHGK
jgi:hypothetical protein